MWVGGGAGASNSQKEFIGFTTLKENILVETLLWVEPLQNVYLCIYIFSYYECSQYKDPLYGWHFTKNHVKVEVLAIIAFHTVLHIPG